MGVFGIGLKDMECFCLQWSLNRSAWTKAGEVGNPDLEADGLCERKQRKITQNRVRFFIGWPIK